MTESAEPAKFPRDGAAESPDAGLTLPLIEEQVAVSKRLQEKGTLRLEKRVIQRSETVEMPLTSVEWDVQHVPVDRMVTEVPPVRQEGDTTIYSLVEERVVMTRQLVLREEVHVTRRERTTVEPVTYTLQKEVLDSTRTGTESGTIPG